MKTRILALALTFSLLLGVPALAAENSTDNFARSKTYAGEFSDLSAGSVFYENVAALYEYGLSVGKGDGTFGLKDSMTVGQIVIFAARIRSLYRTGDAEAGPNAYGGDGDTSTAARYLRYLRSGHGAGRQPHRHRHPGPGGPCAGQYPAGGGPAHRQ